jgi:hypothetical protein
MAAAPLAIARPRLDNWPGMPDSSMTDEQRVRLQAKLDAIRERLREEGLYKPRAVSTSTRIWNVLRWIAVLPAAAIAAILVSFPLHLVLYQTLTGFIEPYPAAVERVLFPLFAAVAFIWFGARVAPCRRRDAAILLFGIWMIMLGVSAGSAIGGARFGSTQITGQYNGLGLLFGAFGALIGLYFVLRGIERG